MSPALIAPSTTRTYTTTPRYVSKVESNTSARRRWLRLFGGAGMRAMTASRMSSMPMPCFALARIASSAGMARISSSCRITDGRSEFGRSILLITGMSLSFCFSARWTFATVCASTPCAASTMRSAPSHAASERETSYAKSTWPGVSMRLSLYSFPSRALYIMRTGCALIVMPRSRSRSIASRSCSCDSRF